MEDQNTTYNLWSCIILWEIGFWQVSNVRRNQRKKDVRNVRIWVQITVDPNKRCAFREPNRCSRHHTRCKIHIPISNCKQATCGLLEATRQAYGYQNTASRTRIRLKRRHWTISVSNIFVRQTRLGVSFYFALPGEAKVLVMSWLAKLL